MGADLTRRAIDASPQTYARIGGMLYLFIIVAALFGEHFGREKLIVASGAATTAANILGSEMVFREGLARETLTCVIDVAQAMILYVLLKPVSRNLALLAVFFRGTSVGVYAVAKLFLVAVVILPGGAPAICKPSTRSNCSRWRTCRFSCMPTATAWASYSSAAPAASCSAI
jgi:hypothetical protein